MPKSKTNIYYYMNRLSMIVELKKPFNQGNKTQTKDAKVILFAHNV